VTITDFIAASQQVLRERYLQRETTNPIIYLKGSDIEKIYTAGLTRYARRNPISGSVEAVDNHAVIISPGYGLMQVARDEGRESLID
jgi:hypothetical protein